MLTARGPHLPPVVEVKQRIEAFVDDQDHVAATAPVTAVRAAPGHELLAPKGDAAVAAVTRAHRDSYRVDEHCSETPTP